MFSKKSMHSDIAILVYFALTKFIMVLFIHPDFGLHRDEFLYWAMADHLDWGYLEVPPLIAVFAKISSFLFGSTSFAVHFFPALTGALTIFFTGLIVKELGGKRFAQILAVICYTFSLVFLRVNILFQPVTFNVFFFVLCVYLLIKILKENQPKHWLLLGVFMGLGLLNKYTMLLFGFGTALGLFFTPYRKLYLNKWLWISSVLAAIIFIPNLIWQYSQDWPLVEHMSALSQNQLSNVNPLIFILVQFLMNLYTFPVWVAGLIFFLFMEKGKAYRPVGWIYIAIFLVLLIFQGKPYYQAATYPMLFAGGALVFENLAARFQKRWIKPAVLIFIITGSISAIPIGIPVFSVNGMISFFSFGSRYMGMAEALRWETGDFHQLPQDFADMLGWEEMVQQIAAQYHNLPLEEQENCAIFASNYGEAGAVDFFGKKYRLPKSISKGSSFWLWGYRDYSGEVLLSVGWNKDILGNFYNDVEELNSFSFPNAREDGIPILLGRHPKMSMAEMWQILKAYRY